MFGQEEKMGKLGMIIVLIAIFVIISFGSWKLNRWFNYRLAYSSQVRTEMRKEIEPLKKRVEILEHRVQDLEKEKGGE